MAALSKIAAERGIKYFLISFTDLFGVQRSKLVPAAAIDGMAKAGAGFAGFATWLDMTPADPDMFALPDPSSLIQLPWKPEVGWLAADPVDERGAGSAWPPQPAQGADRRGCRDGLPDEVGRGVRIFSAHSPMAKPFPMLAIRRPSRAMTSRR
jgi:hypothetical protein